MKAAPASQRFWRDPEMPYVESRRACCSRACYRLHSHPTCSLGAVDAGRSVFTGAPNGSHLLLPGMLVHVPPEHAHACNPEQNATWSYQMLHLDAGWLQALRDEQGTRGAASGAVDARVWISRSPAAYARFCALNALLFSTACVADKEAALIDFFTTPCDAPQPLSPPRARAHLAEQLAPVLAHLHRHIDSALGLAELARLGGMSRYQLIRAFKACTGLTPHAWRLNQRINAARTALRSGSELAPLAHTLGFADQAHFSRSFKAHTGITPGEYRRR